MARNYSNKRSSRQSGSTPHQFLVVIVTFLLGYLTATIFDVETISHWMNTQVLAHHEVKQQPTKPGIQQAQIPPKQKFEFYTLLANEKVGGATQTNVNAAANHTSAPASPTQSTSPSAIAATIHPTMKSNPTRPQQAVPVKVAQGKPLAAAQASKGSYLVQVASFKVRQDAEHMKGLLILKGFDVNVVPVSNAQGNWFRVVVGPYSDRVLAQKAQVSLAKNERLRGMVVGG
jgi:cell division protein FtsN